MRDRPIFANRTEAGRALGSVVAEHLERAGRRDRPLVLALPRGGVPVGYEVARVVGGDLDVIVSRKIGVPSQPELAVGAVAEDGPPLFNIALLRRLALDDRQITQMVARERNEVARRRRYYRGERPPPDVANRTVIVVDDGLATGATARAALAALRTREPAHLVFAAPVCASDSANAIGSEADAVLCVVAPDDLFAVGLWYFDFAQLTDDEVVRLLSAARSAAADAS